MCLYYLHYSQFAEERLPSPILGRNVPVKKRGQGILETAKQNVNGESAAAGKSVRYATTLRTPDLCFDNFVPRCPRCGKDTIIGDDI